MEKLDVGIMSIEEDRECGLIADTPNTSIEGCAETNGNHSLGRETRCPGTTYLKEHEGDT